MTTASLTHLDLSAYDLARAWGLPTTANRLVRPCPRGGCQGSLISFDGGPRRCLLCSRSENGHTQASHEADLALETLMRTPPVPIRSRRATAADIANYPLHI